MIASICFWHSRRDPMINFFSLQGIRHNKANHAACCCLDVKPDSSQEVELLCKLDEVAGMANSSLRPNTEFVDVVYDTIIQVMVDMEEGTELFVKNDHKYFE